ncbi:hypothetical protein MBLNU13_g05264t1 [Cladosporium sp. NU13]
MCISFPYNNIDQVTSTVSIIPYVTQYDDGRLSTSFSTITLEEDPECDFFDEDQFTWVTHGRTLTWPTTYGTLEGFVGRAESTFEPTKTFYGGKDCDGTVGTTALTLPSTLDKGSFIIPLGVSSPTLKAGPLPTYVISYLDSFDTVQEQFNDIPLTLCAPALPVRTACTTVLTSTSTAVSCSTVSGGEESCVTSFETVIETNTHTPHWPTLNGSFTDLKQTAARLTTETQEAITVQATAEPVLEPAAEEPTDEAGQSSGTEAQTNGSPIGDASEVSTADNQDPNTTPTEDTPPAETTISTSRSPGDTESGSIPETDVTSPATGSGSATADPSAATFTGAGPGLLIPGWSLILAAGLVGLWI